MALVDLIEAIARQAAEAMLNGLWQGTALVALVWCLLKVIPRTNATTRYVIWWGTLIAVICLPIVSSRAPLTTNGDTALESQEAPSNSSEIAFSLNADPVTNRTRLSEPAVESISLNEASRQTRTEQMQLEQTDPAQSIFPVRLPARWAIFFFAAWTVIVFVMMGRVVWSYCHLRRLKRNCSPPSQHCQDRLKPWLTHARLKRSVRLCISEETSVPMVIGFMKPVIVIPQSLARELTEEEFEQVVLHEIAHVRRRDDWMKLAQKLIEALLFFHPAVLWLGRRLNLEREIACDDSVISLTGKARPYAACLIKLLELTSLRQSSLLAPGAVTIKRQISSRVEMIVDKRRNATLILSKAGLLVMLLVMALIIAEAARISPVLALIEPDSSSFESDNELLKDEFDPSGSATKEFRSDEAASAHTGTPHPAEAIAGNDSAHDSLAQSSDKTGALQFETAPAQPSGATENLSTQVALWSPVKHKQGSLLEPPHPPTPPNPPNPPPVVPLSPQSVPAPPALPADGSREARAGYDRLMADYNRQVDKYREQMRDYDRSVAEYREQMREYDRQVEQYNNALKRYYEQMERYKEEMKEYEKRIFAMVPGAILNVIAEQIAGVDLKLDAGARDKFNRELEQFAATLAKELTEKYKDLKINRPEGHITIVSFLSTGVLRNRLRQFFSRVDIGLDETAQAALALAADRAAPALQSLIVYRWP
jgi:beta-lactamase regulating signal transducer with metallopeptidase domain